MSACSGTAASTATSTTSASYPRQRSRCASTLALPPSPYVPSNDGKTSAIRTAPSAMSQHLAIGLERRVVGEDLDRSAAVRRRQRRRRVVYPHVVDARVAQPYGDVAGPL